MNLPFFRISFLFNLVTMNYIVRYLNSYTTVVQTQQYQADSMAALQQRLAQENINVVSIHVAASWRLWRKSRAISLVPIISSKEFTTICTELKTLVGAGMTVVEALDSLAFSSASQGLAQYLYEQLAQGKSLSVALSNLDNTPVILLATVRAGEHTSNLLEALNDFLAYDQLMNSLRSKVLSATLYPAIVGCLGLAIVVFLLIVVMPNFAQMYQVLRSSAQGVTRWIIALSVFMEHYKTHVVVLIVGILIALTVAVRMGYVRQVLSALAWHIAPVREQLMHFQLAMLYQTLYLLIKGGYPVTMALKTATETILNSSIQQQLNNVLSEVEQGKPIAASLFRHQLCSEVDRRLLSASERNGDFYKVSQVVSNLHRTTFEHFIERASRLVEPILLLIVAIMVGGIVILMYLPVFELSTQLH
jgi:general secretion pathway protein F